MTPKRATELQDCNNPSSQGFTSAASGWKSAGWAAEWSYSDGKTLERFPKISCWQQQARTRYYLSEKQGKSHPKHPGKLSLRHGESIFFAVGIQLRVKVVGGSGVVGQGSCMYCYLTELVVEDLIDQLMFHDFWRFAPLPFSCFAPLISVCGWHLYMVASAQMDFNQWSYLRFLRCYPHVEIQVWLKHSEALASLRSQLNGVTCSNITCKAQAAQT